VKKKSVASRDPERKQAVRTGAPRKGSAARKRTAAVASGPGTGTVERAVHIMRYFATNPEVTIKELSAALRMSPSTCHRLLDLLAAEGIIEHVKTRRSYQVGLEYCRLAAQVQARNSYHKLVPPFLRAMVRDYNETCIFSLYMPASRSMIFSEKAESSRPLRYQLRFNDPHSVFWGATGRAIYAYLPAVDRRAIYDAEGRSPGSGAPLPEWKDVEAAVRRIREQGYVMTHGQKTAGSVGIAGPVFNAENRVIGSVGFTVPQSEIGTYDVDEIGRYVARKAVELSVVFGATEDQLVAAD
jgi:DNA-binding IclR family transcriptional regulator